MIIFKIDFTLKSFLAMLFFNYYLIQIFPCNFLWSEIVPLQASNQEFFRAGEFSWNQDTSINIHLQHKKEKPRREKISGFFAWKLLEIAFQLKALPLGDHNQGISFHKLGHFSPIFERPPPRLPPLVTYLHQMRVATISSD